MQIEKNKELQTIIDSLSPNERKVIPFLKEKTLEKIAEKSGIDKTSTLRALEFLSNKSIIKLNIKQLEIVELGINGLLYIKQGLPERKLANLIAEKNSMPLKEAERLSKLSENEFKAAIGALKKKALIELINGNILLSGKKEELSEKTLEEKFLETIPRSTDNLKPEEKYALESLKSRKGIIDIQRKKIIEFTILPLGEKIISMSFDSKDMIEVVTPALIKSGNWKGKKFRRYDILSPVPKIYGGKKHFISQSIEYAKKIWIEMGFKEMDGAMTTSSFWNFDSLFTPQDHPAREMQDTFFIKEKISKIQDQKLLSKVKAAHEGKIPGSKGWDYEWREEEARKVLLRTHTTCISSQTLKKIAEKKEFPAKYFTIGKCFRNESVDSTHHFEFNQTEGIVVDENANFRQLLGYLVEFFKKMGHEKIRIRPSYFPYTEPSLEIDVFKADLGKWIELGGAGMFRPEVTMPFFGRHIPVLAWGPGFDRIIMDFFEIKDLREMYSNNLNKLREIKIWRK